MTMTRRANGEAAAAIAGQLNTFTSRLADFQAALAVNATYSKQGLEVTRECVEESQGDASVDLLEGIVRILGKALSVDGRRVTPSSVG